MQKLAVSNQDENMVSLFDWLDKGKPSQPQIIQQLRANHEMQLVAKVIQETEVAHLKKKTSGKKRKLTKTTGLNHWDADIRQAAREKRAQNEEIEQEKAIEKARKEQEKQDKKAADKAQKALSKSIREAKAIETLRKKEIAALEKVEKAKKREEEKTKKAADKTAKAASRASKTINKKNNQRLENHTTNLSRESLFTIEEEGIQSKEVEEMILLLVNQLGYDSEDIAIQLALELKNTLALEGAAEPSSSNHLTQSYWSRHLPQKYDDNWYISLYWITSIDPFCIDPLHLANRRFLPGLSFLSGFHLFGL